jgi:large subunit ribosomal protein L19
MENVHLSTVVDNEDIDKISVGSTIQVTIFLELPKGSDENKKEKERIQLYEGVVISKHKRTDQRDATITVRKMFQGGGIEKVFIVNSPWIKKIKLVKEAKVRKAKLYYLRDRQGKAARLKTKF